MESNVVTCLRCKGGGQLKFSFGGEPPVEIPCGTCDGFGRVRLERIRSVLDLFVSEYRGFVDSLRAAHLAGAITRDHSHLADPVTWLAEHTNSEVYRVTASGPSDVYRLRACEREAEANHADDGGVLPIYTETLRARVWGPFLAAQGWEPAEPGPNSDTASETPHLRAPSGAVYAFTLYVETPALDVALARENVDVHRVLADAQRIITRTRASLGGRARKPRNESPDTGQLFTIGG